MDAALDEVLGQLTQFELNVSRLNIIVETIKNEAVDETRKQLTYGGNWTYPIVECIVQGYAANDYVVPIRQFVVLEGIPAVLIDTSPYVTFRDYLRRHKVVGIAPTSFEYLPLLKQIATGLAYLHSEGIIHRDVCSKHILIGITDDVPRAYLANFKSAAFYKEDVIYPPAPPALPLHHDYALRNGSSLRLRWTAPEVLRDPRLASTNSDVWSYALLVWQALSEGDDPFPDLDLDPSRDLEYLLSLLHSGYRPTVESHWPLQDLLAKLWNLNPSSRPSALEIIDLLPNEATYAPLPPCEIHLENIAIPPPRPVWCTIV